MVRDVFLSIFYFKSLFIAMFATKIFSNYMECPKFDWQMASVICFLGITFNVYFIFSRTRMLR